MADTTLPAQADGVGHDRVHQVVRMQAALHERLAAAGPAERDPLRGRVEVVFGIRDFAARDVYTKVPRKRIELVLRRY